jgi:hypothetical protein
MNDLNKNLKIIFKLNKFLPKQRKKTLIDIFSYKTNKIELMFENISNPMNVVIFF